MSAFVTRPGRSAATSTKSAKSAKMSTRDALASPRGAPTISRTAAWDSTIARAAPTSSMKWDRNCTYTVGDVLTVGQTNLKLGRISDDPVSTHAVRAQQQRVAVRYAPWQRRTSRNRRLLGGHRVRVPATERGARTPVERVDPRVQDAHV